MAASRSSSAQTSAILPEITMRPVLPTGMPDSMLRTTRKVGAQRAGLPGSAPCLGERIGSLVTGRACNARLAGWRAVIPICAGCRATVCAGRRRAGAKRVENA